MRAQKKGMLKVNELLPSAIGCVVKECCLKLKFLYNTEIMKIDYGSSKLVEIESSSKQLQALEKAKSPEVITL